MGLLSHSLRKESMGYNVEVVNDIAVIMRIQGQTFMAAETYEPNETGTMSTIRQTIVSGLQTQGAALLGKMVGRCAVQVVDSELGRRLLRDKWLTAVMASFSRSMYTRRSGDQDISYVPNSSVGTTRELVRRALIDAELQAQRRRESGGMA